MCVRDRKAIEIEALSIDVLNVVRREIAAEALRILFRIEEAGHRILDQAARLFLRQARHGFVSFSERALYD